MDIAIARLAIILMLATNIANIPVVLAEPNTQALYEGCVAWTQSIRAVPDNLKWCACEADEAGKVLSDRLISTYENDYMTFYESLVADPKEIGTWVFQNILNACRACKEANYVGCLAEDIERPSRESFARTLAALRNRDFDTIRENRVYRRFYTNYLAHYGQACREHILKGKIIGTKFTRNFGGGDIQTTDASTLVEDGYIDTYNQYTWYEEKETVGELFRMGKSEAQRKKYMSNLRGTNAVLEEHIQKGCTSEDVRTVYRALYDFSRSVPRHGPISRMTPTSAPAIDEAVLHNQNSNFKSGERFLQENKSKDGVIETSSGLQYRYIRRGSGSAAGAGDQVTVHMRLTLTNGRVVSDTYANGTPSTFTFVVGKSIQGFEEGLKLLKPGGKIQLFIPPALAYGDRAMGNTIPAGSTLIYEIELISIN
jgi:FKBP-type peptidyl-prolyl cis-trans isomerase